MKILFWLSIGLDRRTPSEHLLTAMVKALYKKGHTVHILQKDTCSGNSHLPPVLEEVGVSTTCIVSEQAAKDNLVARYWADVKYVNECKKWLERHKTEFDRVFIQSSNVAGFQTKCEKKIIAGVPIIFNVQDIFPSNAKYSGKLKEKSMAYRILSALQNRAYTDASRIITISEDMKDELVSLGVEASKVEVIYNWGYQDDLYDPAAMENGTIRKMLPKDKFNVVYAGNIGMMQNVNIIIEAAKLMNDDSVQFHIIGDGVYKEKLIKAAGGLTNISFWPMQSSSLAPNIYAMADVNVIPLAKKIYRTALPSKTATCLACQKPIIFAIGKESRFGQWMEEKIGCALIDSNDGAGLCEKIKELQRQPSKCITQEFYRAHFSRTENSEKYAALIVEKGI